MKKVIVLMLCAGMVFASTASMAAAQTVNRDGYSFEIPDGWQENGGLYSKDPGSFPALYIIDGIDYVSREDILSIAEENLSDYTVDVAYPELIIPVHETSYNGTDSLTFSVFGTANDTSVVVQADFIEDPDGKFIYFSYYYNDDPRAYYSILDSLTFGSEAEEPAADTAEPTMGQKNALRSAKSYLDFMPFSYTGLIKQLSDFEGYSEEDATYAADNCGADWNEQAAKCAENYLDFMSFSRDGLIEQLVRFEGYTQEQAEYAAAAVGY